MNRSHIVPVILLVCALSVPAQQSFTVQSLEVETSEWIDMTEVSLSHWAFVTGLPGGGFALGSNNGETGTVDRYDATGEHLSRIELPETIIQQIVGASDGSIALLAITDYDDINMISAYPNPNRLELFLFDQEDELTMRTSIVGGEGRGAGQDWASWSSSGDAQVAWNDERFAVFAVISHNFAQTGENIHSGELYVELDASGRIIDDETDWWDVSHSNSLTLTVSPDGEFLTSTTGDGGPFGIVATNRATDRSEITWPRVTGDEYERMLDENDSTLGAGFALGAFHTGDHVLLVSVTSRLLPWDFLDANQRLQVLVQRLDPVTMEVRDERWVTGPLNADNQFFAHEWGDGVAFGWSDASTGELFLGSLAASGATSASPRPIPSVQIADEASIRTGVSPDGHILVSSVPALYYEETRQVQVTIIDPPVRRLSARPTPFETDLWASTDPTGIWPTLSPDRWARMTRGELDRFLETEGEVSSGRTALMYAAGQSSDPELVRALLRQGSPVDQVDGNEYTALMYAAIENPSVEVVRALLREGADHSIETQYDATALSLAARYNSNPRVLQELLSRSYTQAQLSRALRASPLNDDPTVEYAMTDLMLRAGGDVDSESIFGSTALQTAAIHAQNPDVIDLLMQAGSDIEHQDGAGMTPLMYAAAYNPYADVIMRLLDWNPELETLDNDGRDAWDHINTNGTGAWHARNNVPDVRTSEAYAYLERELGR